jgi:hypothetical protein
VSYLENEVAEPMSNEEKKDALLARYIEKKKAGFAPNEIPRLSSRENTPLSFGQERLWFLYQL